MDSTETKTNPFARYSSKIKRINIELPNYQFFHSPSSEKQVDERFIGRERIINKFKSIFNNNQTKTGAYLVTGYRGMGKSSTVSKVMKELTGGFTIEWMKVLLLVLVFFIIYLISIYSIDFNRIKPLRPIISIFISLIFWLSFLLIIFKIPLKRGCLSNFLRSLKKNLPIKPKLKEIKQFYINKRNRDRRIILKLNLGHEILNEIDILSLIAINIKKEFGAFAYSFRKQYIFYLFEIIIITALVYLTLATVPNTNQVIKDTLGFSVLFPSQDNHIDSTDRTVLFQFNSEDHIYKFRDYEIYKSFKHIEKSSLKAHIITAVNSLDIYLDACYFHLSNFVSDFILLGAFSIPVHIDYLFCLYFLIIFLFCNIFFKWLLNSNYVISTGRRTVLKKLNHLNDQINTIIQEETNVGSTLKKNGVETFFSKKKSKEYPLAGIRQIEKGLIDILYDMERLIKPFLRPQFIIIFDELDKVDPKNNKNDKEETLPSFESSISGFIGGSTTRERKRNVLKLLANMKYFITTAKAKFIFITGRELYDAFLADVSDREFAISSIFHEVFYIDSFLSDDSDNNRNDITSMTEHYLCQFLMPKEYLKIKEDENRKKNKENLMYLSLKTYYDYLFHEVYDIESLNEELKCKELEIKTLETNKRSIQNEITKLKNSVNEFTVKGEKLAVLIHALAINIGKLEIKRNNFETEKRNCINNINEAKASITLNKRAINKKIKEKKTYEKRKRKHAKKKRRLEKKIKELLSEMRRLKGKIEQASIDIDNFKKGIIKAGDNLKVRNQKKRKLETCEQRRTKYEMEKKHFDEEIRELFDKRRRPRGIIKQSNMDIDNLNRDITNVKISQNNSKEELQRFRNRKDLIKEEMSEFFKKQKGLSKKRKALFDRRDNNKVIIKKSVQRINNLNNRREGYSIKIKSLKEEIRELNNEKKDKKAEVDKVIMLLYQFTYYLAHVSNGAPKKITNFFEKYIESENQIETQKRINGAGNNVLIVKNKETKGKSFYLSFGFNTQSKIGFIHYLANPLMQAIVNNVSNYGDKLLVSTSFLLDHIFKFHKNGFSWRNLEHAPEILEINRTPELRNFIKSIITFLKQTHVNPIVSGLYMFKFPKKVSEEISFISKTSEEASAIFNFTLDESLSVKRHYAKMLEYYTKRYNERNFTEPDDDFIHSIAGIHHILGDLKLLDEEYTEAIFEYQDCIQLIPKQFNNTMGDHSLSHILLLVRTMLKLGLAFEKRKTFNSAFATYTEIVSLLIDFRYFDETALDLLYKIEKGNDWMHYKAILFKNKDENKQKNKNRESLPEMISLSEKESSDYLLNGEDIIPKLAKTTTRRTNKIISRLSLFDDERLMYQALLAKLFVIEKSQQGGISRINLDVVEGEFLNLYLATDIKEKYQVATDFFKKLGDILFYKNGLINKKSCTCYYGLDFWGYDISHAIEAYCATQEKKTDPESLKNTFKKLINNGEVSFDESDVEMDKILEKCEKEVTKDFLKNNLPKINPKIFNKIKACNVRRDKLLDNGLYASCYACKYYNRSLKILADNLLDTEDKKENNEDKKEKYESNISKSLIFLEALEEKSMFNSQRNDHISTLAAVLGGFGDIIVGCSNKDTIEKDFLKLFLKYIGEKDFSEFEKYIKKEDCHKGGENNQKKEKTRFEKLKSVLGEMKLSNLEKAILYYYVSAKYYKRSSHMKEAQIMYKKIIQLLVEYTSKDDKSKSSFDDDIITLVGNELVKRVVQSVYSAYDFLHIAEIQRLKWNSTLEMYEDLKLENLSILADLEETFFTYFELQLLCYSDSRKKDVLKSIYGSSVFSPYRLNNTVYNRLISLRLKAKLNRHVLKEILPKYDFANSSFAENGPINYYENLKEIKKTDILIEELENKNDFSLLEHLIIDSVFCLIKFVEVVSPQNKSTLFTNSYLAAIYEELFIWTQLFELTFSLYAYFDEEYGRKEKEEKESVIIDKLIKYVERRKKAKGVVNVDLKEIKEQIEEVLGVLKKKTNVCDAEGFFDKLYFEIGKNNTHYVNSNYMAEMALKYYYNTMQIHNEGKIYKNMIEDMYFLDDDLDNDTLKFFFALERYRINTNSITESIEKLRKIYKNSTLSVVNNYIG